MARDTGKALDNVLDWANAYKGKINMVLVRLEMYRETALTAGELAIINTITALLEKDTDG
jgi:hypothetical protein